MNAVQINGFGKWYCEPHQDEAWRYMAAGGKRAVVVAHRRWGKDDLALRFTNQALHTRVGTYWHMLPMAEQARKAIWTAINPHSGIRRIDEAFPPLLRKSTRTNEMAIEFKSGSTWQVVGSDNYNSLVGSPPIGVVFSEWSLADPAAWAYIRPILRENGGWAMFIYTPRGKNHGFDLLQSARGRKGWFVQVSTALDTDVFTPAELAEERDEQIALYGEELGEAFYRQEYLCDFDAAVLGAIYARGFRAREQAGFVSDAIEWNPDYPVNTAWDFGFSDKTAIWFFQTLPNGQINVIDNYSNTGQEVRHYASHIHGFEILEQDERGPISYGASIPAAEHRQDWVYGRHYAPHDGLSKTLAAGGRSLGDIFYRYNVPMEIIPATTQANQISAGRRVLERCAFHQTRCKHGIAALTHYHYKYDETKKLLMPEPEHDWSSHDADAFEILGQVAQPPKAKAKDDRARFLHEATLDEIMKVSTREKNKRSRV